jgi:hypothetical protein
MTEQDAMPAERAERILRYGMAFIWLATGVLVLHPHYRQLGSEYLGRMGIGPRLMVATCIGEIGFALYLLRCKRMTLLPALMQTAAIGGFTVILAALEPMLLVHYLGVLTKNLPLLACIWAAWLLAEEGWTPRASWLLRAGMAVVWLSEGILPKMLFLQPGEIEFVQAFGLTAEQAASLIWATGLVQAISGVAVLLLRGGWLWGLLLAQCLALAFLPLMVAIVQPLMMVHPFGPLTKSLTIAAGTFVVWRRCASF